MKVAAACALAVALYASQAPAAVSWKAVADGVEHAHLTREGPLSIHVLRVDPSRARLDVVHARDEAVGLETTSAIAERRGAIAAVNGGYFRMTGTFAGDSIGTLQIDGKLLSEPDRGRAAVGIVREPKGAALLIGHVTWEGEITTGGARRRLDGVNRPRGANELVLFTPEFHETTLTDDSGSEVIVRGGRVVDVRVAAGSSGIPSDGYVLSATGTVRAWVSRHLERETPVSVRLGLKPVDARAQNPWPAAEDVLGAGPKLVTAGRIDVTDAREKMLPTFATDRHPRTAVATLADSRVLLMVVDGRQPDYSIGMTLADVAGVLREFGAVEAINLDGGGSTTMVVAGTVVNRPSDVAGERPVSDVLLILPPKS